MSMAPNIRAADAATIVGTVYAAANAILSEVDDYQRFRAGAIRREDYCAIVDACADKLRDAGVLATDIPFLKRFPNSPADLVDRILDDVARRGIIPASAYDCDLLDRIESSLADRFFHGPFKTFIYPEEGRLLGALAAICRPRRALFLGSYYGYWAHWAIPGVVEGGGRVILVDPDEQSCAVARRNLRENRHEHAVDIVTMRGEDFLVEARDTFDFVVLDAEGPRDHVDPEQRGKRVYLPLTRACLPHMAPGALFICHNVLFNDDTGDPAFVGIITRNRDELGPFVELVDRSFGPFIEYGTTEGVGIGRYIGARDKRGEP